jgi:hypothetical protein
MSFLGAAGSRNRWRQRLLPVRQHARHLPASAQALGRGLLHAKAAQGLAPLVGDDLHGRAQVERAELRVGGNGERHMAAVHVLVGHAEALGAKQKAMPLGRHRLWN